MSADYWVNFGCGPFRAQPPWLNVDVVETKSIKPDVLVSNDSVEQSVADLVAEIGKNRVSRLYLGHVLEHVPWDECATLMHLIAEHVLERDAMVLVVGPDMTKVVEGIRTGKYQMDLYDACAEDANHFQTNGHPDVKAGRHHWNCTTQRVVDLLTDCGYQGAGSVALGNVANTWPITSTVEWQCAVRATAPPF